MRKDGPIAGGREEGRQPRGFEETMRGVDEAEFLWDLWKKISRGEKKWRVFLDWRDGVRQERLTS